MSEHTALLPCPFCGGKAEIWAGVDDYRGMFPMQRIRCIDCNDVRMSKGGNEDQQPALIVRWNTRPALIAERDALRRALQGVLRVADRATVEFDAARAALGSTTEAGQ